jgi:hypothetical protein
MTLSRRVLLVVLLVVVGLPLAARFCRRDVRQAMVVDEGRLTVTNLTGTAWSDVEVWLNDYYRAQAPRVEPDQRLEVPLDAFIGGYGRQFDPRRQAAKGLELTAHGADGRSIRLTWGQGRRR